MRSGKTHSRKLRDPKLVYRVKHFDPVTVDGIQIQATTSSKFLGLIINNTVTWNDHVDSLIKKAARKIYLLVQLKRERVPAEDLVAYYCACIRSSLDYACPVSIFLYLSIYSRS